MSKAKLITTVCVGALALSAFASTTSAMANWMVNGTNLNGTRALATTARVDEESLVKFGGNVAVRCHGETLNEVNIQIESATEMGASSKLEFTGCSANENCTVPTTISTEPVLVDVTLDGPLAIWATFLPKTKTIFATIPLEGEKCALAGNVVIIGKAKMLVPTGQDERTLQLLVANVTEGSGELKTSLGLAAELKSSALLRLASGESWSFL
jgi:hypothetical protein